PAYVHFTSPIRRNPDLVAHRGLLSAIGAGEDAPRAEGLAELGAHCSERERDATRTERDADSICGCFVLERELFEGGPDTRFEGEVSGVVGAGAFVHFGGTLADVYEGFLPARRIGGRGRYELDATETMLGGARGGAAIRIGDPKTVTVDRGEAPRGRGDLLPSEAGGPSRRGDGGRRRRGAPRRSARGPPPQVPAARAEGGGHRASRQRGEVSPRRQGSDQRGLRRGRWRRGLAPRRAHPAVPAGLRPEPRPGPSPQVAPPS